MLFQLPLLATNEVVYTDYIAAMLSTNEPANKQQLYTNLNTTTIGYEPRKFVDRQRTDNMSIE